MTSAAAPQRLLAVEMDLDRTARELFALRDQVARIRSDVAPAAWPVPDVAPAIPLSALTPSRRAIPALSFAHPPSDPGDEPVVEPSAPPWWRRVGTVARVLSVAGAGVLLIGVTFLLVLAVQHGYIGAVPRVVAGVTVSAVLVVLGFGVHRRQADNPGAVALVATGVAGGYLVVVAVTAGYRWVGLPAGLVLAGGVGVLGLGLARRWGSQVLAGIVLLGVGTLAPLVADERLWMAVAFLVLVSAAATAAIGRRDWWVAHLARVVPTALVLVAGAVVTDSTTQPAAAWLVAGLAAAHAVLVVVGEVRLHRVEPGPRRSAVLVAVAIVPALVAPLWLTEGWLTTLWLALLAGGWLTLSTRSRSSMLGTVLVAAGAVSLLLAVGSLAIQGSLVSSCLVIALVFVGAGVLRRDHAVGWVGIAAGALGGLGYLPVALPLLAPSVVGTLGGWDLVASVAALALAVTAVPFLRYAVPRRAAGWGWTVLLPLGLLSVVGLCVSAGSLLGTLLGDGAAGFLAGHAVATLTWMVAAAVVLLSTLRRPDATRLRVAVALTGLAVAKLLLFDLATLDGLIRVGAFVVVGAILLAVGTRYARSVGPATG